MRKVKTWNGGAMKGGKQWHLCVGATSVRQALELIEQAGFGHMGAHHFKDYYSPCWGNNMQDVEPTIGVWGYLDNNKHLDAPPKKLV